MSENYLAGYHELLQGRFESAFEIFTQEPSESPAYTLARGQAAYALLKLCRYAEAEQLAATVIGEILQVGCIMSTCIVQFVRNNGEAISYQGRHFEALDVFRRAIQCAEDLKAEHPDLSAALDIEIAHTLNSFGVAMSELGAVEPSISAFRRARDIHAQNADQGMHGRAEVLTNLAQAFARQGSMVSAKLAFQEALDVVAVTGDHDQRFRILTNAGILGIPLIPANELISHLKAGADSAAAAGRLGIAYLRYIMGANAVESAGEVPAGRQLIQRARELEPRLDAQNADLPHLPYVEAHLMLLEGKSPSEIVSALIGSAHRWYGLLMAPLGSEDFSATSSRIHIYFRQLAGCLLDLGRVEESLVAFEAGRALSYSVEVDRDFFRRVIERNPFPPDEGTVRLDILREAQETLLPNEAAVVLALIPPRLTGFVIARDAVTAVSREVGTSRSDLVSLDGDVRKISLRIMNGLGAGAMPASLLEFAADLAGRLDGLTVRSFVPYDSLHLVPWRSVLRHCGIPWTQLPFSTGFSFLLRTEGGPSIDLKSLEGIGLGHGKTRDGGIDLCEEAESFAAAFGQRGRAVISAVRREVTEALRTHSIVLLSCHGSRIDQTGWPRVSLALADGLVDGEEVLPASITAPVVILSACESGVYEMAWSDYPMGLGPTVILRGASYCLGSRFKVDARFAAQFFTELAVRLSAGSPIDAAFVETLADAERWGANLWNDLACLELLGRV
jgi:tetratricopeptide (TPR) repeat protein